MCVTLYNQPVFYEMDGFFFFFCQRVSNYFLSLSVDHFHLGIHLFASPHLPSIPYHIEHCFSSP
jgi:hypothetical protein